MNKEQQEYEYIGECKGNDGNGCFMDSSAHNCGCFVRNPKQELVERDSDLDKEDFKNFTNEEILNLLVDVVNRMESNGNHYMKYYNESQDKDFDIDKYTYAAGLLTQVNYVKNKINFKNKTIESYE